MKKFINLLSASTLLLFLVPSSLMAQWANTPVTDSFGDETGKYVKSCLVEGTMSNSATIGSDLIVKIIIWDDYVTLHFYEYGRTPGTLAYRNAPGEITFRTETGTYTSKVTYLSSNRFVYVESNTLLYKEITTGSSEIHIIVKGKDFSEYESVVYNFKVAPYSEE